MTDTAEAAPTPAAPTTKAGQRLIDMLAQIDPEPQGIGWVRDAILAIEAEARSTPAEALDVETVMRAIDAMKAPSEAGHPHGDWISVSVVRSILEGRHPLLARLSRNEEADDE